MLGRFCSLAAAPCGGTERDHVLPWCAIDERWRGVVGIAVVGRARLLEELGVDARLACARRPIFIPAAELVEVEGQASALARHHLPLAAPDLQLLRAQAVHVLWAASNCTFLGCVSTHDRDWNVVSVTQKDYILYLCHKSLIFHPRVVRAIPVDQANIIEARLGLVSLECNLDQCSRGSANEAIAGKTPVTVSSVTCRLPVGVELAAGSSPDPPGPTRRGKDAFGLAGGEVEPTVSYNRVPSVGSSCWPYGKGALVVHIKCYLVCCCIPCEWEGKLLSQNAYWTWKPN